MLLCYLPLRKLKILWKSDSRYELTPSSLADCLDQPSRRETWRVWLIILFLLPTIYYIKDLPSIEKARFISPGSKYKDVLLRRLTEKNIIQVTEPTTAMTITYTETTTRIQPDILPTCDLDKSTLGDFTVRKPPTNENLVNQYPTVLNGGYYAPVGCHSRHRVALLIPYRNRKDNLAMFLFNIHPFLMKQKLEYRLFVVEQKGTDKFNKGRLFNAGFEELKKHGSWHCIIFHDVDLIPLDERILYSCPFWPRHMCATVVQKYNDPSYRTLFGGVTSMTSAQYEKVNGYSNLYWGWGGEDHDMFWRLRFAGFPVTRYNKTIARYTSLPHPISPPNQLRYNLLRRGLGRYKQEGLSTLEYKLVSVTKRHLYTHITVDINPAREI